MHTETADILNLLFHRIKEQEETIKRLTEVVQKLSKSNSTNIAELDYLHKGFLSFIEAVNGFRKEYEKDRVELSDNFDLIQHIILNSPALVESAQYFFELRKQANQNHPEQEVKQEVKKERHLKLVRGEEAS